MAEADNDSEKLNVLDGVATAVSVCVFNEMDSDGDWDFDADSVPLGEIDMVGV